LARASQVSRGGVKRRSPAGARSSGLALALLAAQAIALSPSAASEPPKRALVIGLDGTRGDVFDAALAGHAPALRALRERGRFARCSEPRDPQCARAHSSPRRDDTYQWITGPGWLSVLTGVGAFAHGVRDNEKASLARFCASSRVFPSFLARARSAGLRTAAGGTAAFVTSLYGDDEVVGVLDYECGCSGDRPAVARGAASSCNASERLSLDGRDPERDRVLARWLLARIEDEEVAVAIGVFDRIDEAGHRHGFGIRPESLRALSETDALLAPIFAALDSRARERGEHWLVVVTADHGGHEVAMGYGLHDTRAGEDDAIPFGVARFEPAATPRAPRRLVAPVTQMDVHPTVLAWLGLPIAPGLEGRVQGLR
jgi:hypothetical protein